MGFKIFMDIFLEVETPDELCRHLFLSFVRMPQSANPEGKTLQVNTDSIRGDRKLTGNETPYRLLG